MAPSSGLKMRQFTAEDGLPCARPRPPGWSGPMSRCADFDCQAPLPCPDRRDSDVTGKSAISIAARPIKNPQPLIISVDISMSCADDAGPPRGGTLVLGHTYVILIIEEFALGSAAQASHWTKWPRLRARGLDRLPMGAGRQLAGSPLAPAALPSSPRKPPARATISPATRKSSLESRRTCHKCALPARIRAGLPRDPIRKLRGGRWCRRRSSSVG